jgi:hypothetical protein
VPACRAGRPTADSNGASVRILNGLDEISSVRLFRQNIFLEKSTREILSRIIRFAFSISSRACGSTLKFLRPQDRYTMTASPRTTVITMPALKVIC